MRLSLVATLALGACAAVRSPAPVFVVDSGNPVKPSVFDIRLTCDEKPAVLPAFVPLVLPDGFVGIAGRVKDPRGWTVVGATVVVMTPQASVEITGEDGRYALALPPGSYDVTFYAEDVQVDVKAVVVPASGHATLDQIVPVGPRQPASSETNPEKYVMNVPPPGASSLEHPQFSGELVGRENLGDSHKVPWVICR